MQIRTLAARVVFIGFAVAVAGAVLRSNVEGKALGCTEDRALSQADAVVAKMFASPRPAPTVFIHESPGAVASDDYPADGYPFIEGVRTLPHFAGVWWEADKAIFHVAMAGELDDALDAIDRGAPRGTLAVHHVAYSYAELERLSGRVFNERDEWICAGISINSFGVSETENLVELGIKPYTPEAIAALRLRYPGPIRFFLDDEVGRLN